MPLFYKKKQMNRDEKIFFEETSFRAWNKSKKTPNLY